MPDDAGNAGTPAGGTGTPPAGGAAPAAPAGGQQPLPGTAPAAAPAARTTPAGKTKPGAPAPKGGNDNVTMPRASFKDRVQREANAIARKLLGMPVEEAAAALKNRAPAPAAPAGGAAPAAGAPPPAPAHGRDDRVTRLEREKADLKRRLDAQKQKNDRIRSKGRDERVALELRQEALVAGVIGEHVDFALDLYANACRANRENPPELPAFIAELKPKRPYLFGGGVQTVPLSPTTSAPPTTAPGGAEPKSKPPGETTPPKNVDDMDEREFADYKKTRYRSRY